RPLRRAIVWNDHRCHEESRKFAERFGAGAMYQKSGWQLGHGLNALQIAWLRANEPDVFRNARYFLSVPDFISMKLTGRPAVDISNAGISQLTDIRKQAYDADILAFAGIGEERLAPIVSSGTAIGPLTREAADELGLHAGTLVTAGAHDQYAALLGAGITKPGEVLIGTGTAWVVTCLTDAPAFDSGFSQSVSAVPGSWGSLVSLSYGGVCKDWFRKSVMGGAGGRPLLAFDEIDKGAANRTAAADGLMFFPYFGAGAYPLDARASKGSVLGLDLSHDAFHLARAVMEGVSFHTVWILEHFRQYFDVTRISMSGGAAKSGIWPQITADILGSPIRLPATRDLSGLGAAILAGVGSGVFRDAGEGCARFGSAGETVVAPDGAAAAAYAGAFRVFKQRARELGAMYANVPA
ncbi:MAG TPA: FGGY family carbohydrate kinase, partial [Candidatus Limnocylindria bacterium]|nr:FGGY family carbohydrate kinase [Candidatus Limnocylindria bacterium]